jgi:hypothetical protein
LLDGGGVLVSTICTDASGRAASISQHRRREDKIKTVNPDQLELPVLRAMIYEAVLLNMCGAPAATLPDRK